MEPTDELYRQCEGLLASRVEDVLSRKPYLDRDELKSIANSIFCDACRSFDGSKGAKFTTYLYKKLSNLEEESRRVLVPDGSGGYTVALNVDDFGEDNEGNMFKVRVDKSVILPASIAYAERMADDGHSELFSHCDKVLSADSAKVVGDIVDGELDPKYRKGTAVHDRRYSGNCVMNARRLWLRRYRNMGWTVEQCERTLKEVRSIVNQYSRGRLPCRLVRV
jgi:hypothetical protein